MRADAVVEIQPQRYPYGPKLHPTPLGERVIDRHKCLVERHRPALRFVARAFGSKGVAELERLATAYLVHQSKPEMSIEEKAQRLRKLKPHIGIDDALSAMEQIHAVMRQVKELEAVA